MRKVGFAGLLALVGALGAMGCAQGAGSTETSADEPGVATAPLTEAPAPAKEQDKAQGKRHERRDGMRHEGGPLALLRVAMQELELSEAQKTTIDGALASLRDGKEERGPKSSAVSTALAAGLRAGKIDEAAVLAKAGAERDDAHRAQLAKALDTLHETLTAEQRSKLVATMTERMDKAGPKDHAGKGAADGDRAGKRGAAKERKGESGPLAHLLRGIELREDQQKRVDEALAALKPSATEREAMKERGEAKRAEMRARLATFATDGFDAKAFLADKDGEGHEAHATRMVKAVAAIAPILDASQREALAARLEAGPEHGKRGPKGARGGARPGAGARERGAPESL